MPWPEFMADWRRYLSARPLPRGGAQALQRLKFIDDPKQGGPWAEWAELDDPRAREFARLGELMRERGRPVAARLEYRKALDRGGARVAVLASQFAVVAIQTGRPAEAEQVLGEALGWNPDHPALRVRLGRLLLEREDFAGAREQLSLANRQDPFDPEIHAGLALALRGARRPGYRLARAALRGDTAAERTRHAMTTDARRPASDLDAVHQLGEAKKLLLAELGKRIVGQRRGGRRAAHRPLRPRPLPLRGRARAWPRPCSSPPWPRCSTSPSAASSSRPT